MYMNHYGYGSGFGALSFAWHIVGIVVAIAVIVLVLRILFGGRGRHWRHWEKRWGSHSALEILNERYAKGEINKEEYEERKKTLLGE